MLLAQVIVCIVGLEMVFGQKGKDKDEDRPYEFGFNIDGYQHRHEKKDENGIIMGEFGFITADGIYHVTVYATDENGDFKILKMKNIKVGFPPGSGTKPSAPKPVTSKPAAAPAHPSAQPLQPAATPKVPTQPLNTPGVFSSVTTTSTTPRVILNNGCGSCKVPVPTTKKPSTITPVISSQSPPGGVNTFGTRPPGGTFGIHPSQPGSQSPGSGIFSSQSPPSQGIQRPTGNNFGSQSPPVNNFGNQGTPPENNIGIQQHPGGLSTRPPSSGNNGIAQPFPGNNYGGNPSTGTIGNKPSPAGFNNPGSSFGSPSPPGNNFGSQSPGNVGSQYPTTNSPAGGQPFPPSGSISHQPPSTGGGVSHSPAGPITGEPRPIGGGNTGGIPAPGSGAGGQPPTSNGLLGIEKPGLPNGITESDVKDLLYRFNYTVGFHGHNEEGYRNGDKKGGYFVNGRDGISVQVKYLANEFGYQPNITFVPLGLNSPDTPKEETEKNYGLKGYAFEWFYKR